MRGGGENGADGCRLDRHQTSFQMGVSMLHHVMTTASFLRWCVEGNMGYILCEDVSAPAWVVVVPLGGTTLRRERRPSNVRCWREFHLCLEMLCLGVLRGLRTHLVLYPSSFIFSVIFYLSFCISSDISPPLLLLVLHVTSVSVYFIFSVSPSLHDKLRVHFTLTQCAPDFRT